MTYIIGIAGPTGCGKSELCDMLKADLKSPVLEMDEFFLESENAPMFGHYNNWDDPRALNLRSFYSVLGKLKQGLPASYRPYSKKTGKLGKKETLHPTEILLAEGFLLFYDKKIRDLIDLRIFLDLPSEVCFERRRNRPGQNSIYASRDYFENCILPGIERNIMPNKEHAHHVVDANRNFGEVLAEVRNRTLQNLMKYAQSSD